MTDPLSLPNLLAGLEHWSRVLASRASLDLLLSVLVEVLDRLNDEPEAPLRIPLPRLSSLRGGGVLCDFGGRADRPEKTHAERITNIFLKLIEVSDIVGT